MIKSFIIKLPFHSFLLTFINPLFLLCSSSDHITEQPWEEAMARNPRWRVRETWRKVKLPKVFLLFFSLQILFVSFSPLRSVFLFSDSVGSQLEANKKAMNIQVPTPFTPTQSHSLYIFFFYLQFTFLVDTIMIMISLRTLVLQIVTLMSDLIISAYSTLLYLSSLSEICLVLIQIRLPSHSLTYSFMK